MRRPSAVQRRNMKGLSPDQVLFSDSVPVAVLEAEKPMVSIESAFEQGMDYAGRIGCDFVFACNGPTFRSLHAPTGKLMFLNNLEVTEPLPPSGLRKFCQDRSNNVFTVPRRVIGSRAQLISVFESLNNVLRQAGIRAGLERFTEFANILFLKLISERDAENRTWSELLSKRDDDLPGYLNDFVIDSLKKRHDSDVLSETRVNGPALKRIAQEPNPLHLQGVDEDLKGVAFEHFLSRTTAVTTDLGEYVTPRSVVWFMVQLLNPRFGNTICDPFCGTERGGNRPARRIGGQSGARRALGPPVRGMPGAHHRHPFTGRALHGCRNQCAVPYGQGRAENGVVLSCEHQWRKGEGRFHRQGRVPVLLPGFGRPARRLPEGR